MAKFSYFLMEPLIGLHTDTGFITVMWMSYYGIIALLAFIIPVMLIFQATQEGSDVDQ
jgi:hypothetical protein